MIKSQRTSPLFALVALLCSTYSAWGQFASPGPEHNILKAMEGTWDFEFKSADGSVSKGVSTYTMECNGLWLTSDFKTDFGGAPFQGKGMDGYDPARKKYVAIWVDSMTTYPMIFEGDYDAASHQLKMTSKSAGPDGKPATWRSVTTYDSKDQHTFDMYLAPEGAAEQKMMTVVYRRKK